MPNSSYEHSLPDLKAGLATCAASIVHLHVNLELLYVFKGDIRIMISGAIYTLSPGDCAVILPGVVHSHIEGTAYQGMLMVVCASSYAGQYEEILQKNIAETPVIRKEQIRQNVAYLFRLLTDQLTQVPAYAPKQQTQILRAQLQLLFAYLLPLLHLRRRSVSDLPEVTQRILEYISEHLNQKLSLDILAKALGISKFKISRIFTNHLHVNFNQYVNELRVNAAKNMLATTSEPITSICYECGFSAVRTFNAAFFAITGKTPGEYRKESMAGEAPSK